MKSIGGFFELELNSGNEFHPNAISLNSGRNALEYLLKANNYSAIYLPYYTCDVLLQPIKKIGINFEFYSINEQLEPVFEFSKLGTNDSFLYTNYFGLKTNIVKQLSNNCSNLIVDNAQSFYSTPIANIDTFYSPRKFFGVPDGAYLYTNNLLQEKLKRDTSFERFNHLIKRIDLSAEEAFEEFKFKQFSSGTRKTL